MTITELLSQLRDLDVRLWAEGEMLRYSAPGGVLTPALRADIASRKTEILRFLGGARTATTELTIAKSEQEVDARGRTFPLSLTQMRLLAEVMDGPGDVRDIIPLRNLGFAIRFKKPISAAAMEQSLGEIVRRHEALRTSFTQVDGEYAQRIDDPSLFRITRIDLQEVPRTDRQSVAQSLELQVHWVPLALERGLFRATVLLLGELGLTVVVTVSHFVWDAWSRRVFLEELETLYRALSAGEQSPLPEPHLQYRDFARWERAFAEQDGPESAWSLWEKRLEGSSPFLKLPTRRPPSVSSNQANQSGLVLNPTQLARLLALGRTERATPFMTFLAAYKILLYRHTGQEIILVRTTVANRNRSEVQGLIGFFANIVCLRTDISGDLSFRELLQNVRAVVLEAFDHQDFPIVKLAEQLWGASVDSLYPMLPISFPGVSLEDKGSAALEPTPFGEIEVSRLKKRPIHVPQQQSRFVLSFSERPEGMVASWGYNPDVFEHATVGRFLGDLRALLEGIATDPDKRVCELPMRNETAHSQVDREH